MVLCENKEFAGGENFSTKGFKTTILFIPVTSRLNFMGKTKRKQSAHFSRVLTSMSMATLVFITNAVVAEDITTTDGNIYTNAIIKKVEPDGILVSYADGISKLKFKNLPPEVAKKYGYDLAKAESYEAIVQQTKLLQRAKEELAEQSKKTAISQQKAQNINNLSQNQNQSDKITMYLYNVQKWQMKLNTDTASLDSIIRTVPRYYGGKQTSALESRERDRILATAEVENDRIGLKQAQEELRQARAN
jgi:hypothetical protein